ncbi:MAG: glucose-1-phosphate thymidylyltransferase RfbA [Rhodospirillaceae bacterium]|jgi:glucose-1-phosphate thymidylyltransferase|nr:glucose-1-phosphate thymidylyltransferase RfbA [Rhodospirillaceae bacterium]
MPRKGILLAGGRGTRLWPSTAAINKQLLPVYDKPMIYYPLSVLMLAGILDILVISQAESLPSFKRLLGDGNQLGLSISYAVQDDANGIAEAFLIAEDFIQDEPSALILGDNIFHGNDLSIDLQKVSNNTASNTIFGYYLDDPSGMGVVVLNGNGEPVDIVEKPPQMISNWSVPGLYFYAPGITELVHTLTPSDRGELEISDLNKILLQQNSLDVQLFGRGIAWLDSGTNDMLLEASEYVRVMEKRTGLKICCPEEIAYRNGFIDAPQLKKLAEDYGDNPYASYLLDVLERA